MARRALLVVDVQNDFLPGGALAVPDGNQVIPVINRISSSSLYDAVFFTKDWHPAQHGSFASVAKVPVFSRFMLHGIEQIAWPDHCVQNTHGAAFADDLNMELPGKLSRVIRKGTDPRVDSYSGFFDNGRKECLLDSVRYSTELDMFLGQMSVTDVDVCGLATDYCVCWTVLDALQLGYRTRLIRDASRGLDPVSTAAALTRVEEAGGKLVESSEL